MPDLARKKLILAIIGAIGAIAYGMNYANTFHEFVGWTASLLPDTMSRAVYKIFLDFVMQPISMAGFAFPVGYAILAGMVFGMGLARRRRHRNRWL